MISSVFEDIVMCMVNRGIVPEALVLGHTALFKTNSSQAELQKLLTSVRAVSGTLLLKNNTEQCRVTFIVASLFFLHLFLL